jgi:hypothetical protein
MTGNEPFGMSEKKVPTSHAEAKPTRLKFTQENQDPFLVQVSDKSDMRRHVSYCASKLN